MLGLGGLSVRFTLLTLFTSNFIGVVFARTLHYQFYCWYFHTLPFLLWHCSRRVIPPLAKLAILVAIEVSFNVYPATWWSSALLQVHYDRDSLFVFLDSVHEHDSSLVLLTMHSLAVSFLVL